MSEFLTDATTFPSLAAMRIRHHALVKLFAEGTSKPERRHELEVFLANGERTGTILQSRADRSAAQALLDYWIGVFYATFPSSGHDSVPDVVLAPFNAESAPDLSEKRCPFIGLSAFEEADADRFYGREEATKTLVEKVLREEIVLVTGPPDAASHRSC